MSKGNQVIPVRFSEEELAAMDRYLGESVLTRFGEPWTRSSFIRKAVIDKLDHIRRSRKGKRRPEAPAPGSDGSGGTPGTTVDAHQSDDAHRPQAGAGQCPAD